MAPAKRRAPPALTLRLIGMGHEQRKMTTSPPSHPAQTLNQLNHHRHYCQLSQLRFRKAKLGRVAGDISDCAPWFGPPLLPRTSPPPTRDSIALAAHAAAPCVASPHKSGPGCREGRGSRSLNVRATRRRYCCELALSAWRCKCRTRSAANRIALFCCCVPREIQRGEREMERWRGRHCSILVVAFCGIP